MADGREEESINRTKPPTPPQSVRRTPELRLRAKIQEVALPLSPLHLRRTVLLTRSRPLLKGQSSHSELLLQLADRG